MVQLRVHEGIREKPYVDTVGKLTIGVGRNLTDVGLFPSEINFLLINNIIRCHIELDQNIPWWVELDDVRKRVLLDMCFNLGINGLLGFRNTLRLVFMGDFAQASSNMLMSKWARQVGKRANRLAEMMRTGIDTTDF